MSFPTRTALNLLLLKVEGLPAPTVWRDGETA